MTTKLAFSMLDVGKTGGFYSNGVDPADIFRHPGRVFIGEGYGFEGATRGNNATLNWLHTYSSSNELFSASSDIITTTINASATSIILSGVSAMATSGYVKIDEEIISYSSITGTTLNGCVRGVLGTTAASHTAGAIIKKQFGPLGSAYEYFITSAKTSVVSDRALALTGASHSLYQDAIGVGGLGVKRNDGSDRKAWGSYFQGDRESGTLGKGSVWGVEIGVLNFAGVQGALNRKGVTPYVGGYMGQTIGLSIQSGGGSSNSFTADNPISIAKGGKDFFRGIVFQDGSIVSPNGTFLEAILMPKDYVFSWYGGGETNRAAEIGSSVTSNIFGQQMLLEDYGLTYRLQNSHNLFNVEFDALAVNAITVQPGRTGSPSRVKATGVDTNIDLYLQSKGTGILRFSYSAAAATTAANFVANRRIPIKDGNGNTVYLAASTTAW